MNPKISVIITCYNYAQFLSEAVESVIEQTCQDFEIVVVNDGSTDNSKHVAGALIMKYLDYRIKLINQVNQGLPTARNVGIKNSEGVYILPLDADDKLDPTTLEKMARVLDQDQKVAIVYSWVKHFGDVSMIRKYPEYDFEVLKKGNFIVCSSMFRKSIWQVCGGYDPNMKWGYEDLEFWINCGKRGFYGKLIPEPLLLYRRHAKQMTETMLKHTRELWAQIKSNHRELYYSR